MFSVLPFFKNHSSSLLSFYNPQIVLSASNQKYVEINICLENIKKWKAFDFLLINHFWFIYNKLDNFYLFFIKQNMKSETIVCTEERTPSVQKEYQN